MFKKKLKKIWIASTINSTSQFTWAARGWEARDFDFRPIFGFSKESITKK